MTRIGSFGRFAKRLWSRRTFGRTIISGGRDALGGDWHQVDASVASLRLSRSPGARSPRTTTSSSTAAGRCSSRPRRSSSCPTGAGEDEHLALLGVLNSSVACFWLKQVCQPKGSGGIGRGIYDEAWEDRLRVQRDATSRIYRFPIDRDPGLARALDAAADRTGQSPRSTSRAPHCVTTSRPCAPATSNSVRA